MWALSASALRDTWSTRPDCSTTGETPLEEKHEICVRGEIPPVDDLELVEEVVAYGAGTKSPYNGSPLWVYIRSGMQAKCHHNPALN